MVVVAAARARAERGDRGQREPRNREGEPPRPHRDSDIEVRRVFEPTDRVAI